MSITLSDLITICRQTYNSAVGDTFFSDAWMRSQVWTAECEFAIHGWVIENSLYTTSVAGTRVLAYPSNVLGIKELRYDYVKIRKVPLDQDPKASATEVTGTPEGYGIWDKEIFLFPTPANTGDRIEIRIYALPQQLTSATSPLNVPEEYQIQIKDYVLAQMAFKDLNIALGQVYLQKWEQSVERARQQKRKAERADKYTRVKDVYFGTDAPRWDEKGLFYGD
jgi:hypothetical protein